jgi:hypothetical protein
MKKIYDRTTPHHSEGGPPVLATLDPADTYGPVDLRRIGFLPAAVRARLDDEITNYNGGQFLGIEGMATLFGVKKDTIYAWLPPGLGDENAEPAPASTEYLPVPDGPDGKSWSPWAAILWGLESGKLDWHNPGFGRRTVRRLHSPGRNRRSAASN